MLSEPLCPNHLLLCCKSVFKGLLILIMHNLDFYQIKKPVSKLLQSCNSSGVVDAK